MADAHLTVRGVFELTLRLEGDHFIPDLRLYDSAGEQFTLPVGGVGAPPAQPSLHPDDALILRVLAKSGLPMFQVDIAVDIQRSRFSVIRRLHRLEHLGLVSRPSGRYGFVITEKGRALRSIFELTSS